MARVLSALDRWTVVKHFRIAIMNQASTNRESMRDDRGITDLSVIVVNYNTAHLLHEMWAALDRARGSLTLQTIVIDNASRDDSVALLRQEFPEAHVIVNGSNVGFGRANNQAIPLITGRYVLLLNTDAFVAPDTLAKTVAYMEAHPPCGILGVRLVGRDGSLQPSCRYFPTPWNVFLQRTGLRRYFPGQKMVDDLTWDHAATRDCDWVPGCYYLVRRELIDEVGLFDPRYFLYYEEVDHCRSAKDAGWKVVFYPHTEVVHIGGESSKSDSELTASGRQIAALQVESELLYFRKWAGPVGVIQAVFLHTLADAIVALKQVLRRRGAQQVMMSWRQFAMRLRLVLRTRLGSRPTR